MELENVCLDIPVEGVGSRSLKSALVGGLTGGLLNRDRGGALAVQALTDLDFTINKGERVALLGHNGAGKSTLLRLLSDIYAPTTGRIEEWAVQTSGKRPSARNTYCFRLPSGSQPRHRLTLLGKRPQRRQPW